MAYSPKVWSAIRSAYESGRYASIEEMCEKQPKNNKKWPSIDRIRLRAAADNWNRGAMQPIVDMLTRESVLRELSSRIKPKQIVDAISEQFTAQKAVVTGYDDGVPLSELVQDNQAVDKAITQTAKMAGLYAPTQVENLTKDQIIGFVNEISVVVLANVIPEKLEATRLEIAGILSKYGKDI
jgi:hypothetical protein